MCSRGIVFSLICLFKNKQAHKYPTLPYSISFGTFSVTVIYEITKECSMNNINI
jgi:hypothetical protein